METDGEESPSQRVLKILVVGDMGSGKTSIVRKYVQGLFSEYYRSTIGVDFANKIIPWKNNMNANVQLWDISGQERYGSLTALYFREAVGAILVFDLHSHNSIEPVQYWKNDIDEKVQTSEGQPIPTLLIGNKVDLIDNDEEWEERKVDLEQYAKDNNFLAFFETSAKDGTNVDDAFYKLVDYIMENNIESESARELVPGVDITDTSLITDNKMQCCH